MAWDKTKPADGATRVASDIRNNFEVLDKEVRGDSHQLSQLNGPDGVTVNINPPVEDEFYNVSIELQCDDLNVGNIWITDKTTSSFVVRNSGGSRAFFNWSLNWGS